MLDGDGLQDDWYPYSRTASRIGTGGACFMKISAVEHERLVVEIALDATLELLEVIRVAVLVLQTSPRNSQSARPCELP